MAFRMEPPVQLRGLGTAQHAGRGRGQLGVGAADLELARGGKIYGFNRNHEKNHEKSSEISQIFLRVLAHES